MGAPCTGETSVPVFGDVCGTKHRVAVEYDAGYLRPFTDAPCELTTFVRKKQPAPRGEIGESVSACVVGQELLAQGETPCPMCRIPQPRGWAFHGRIDEMTGEQNIAIYQRLGLAGVAPATATAWSSLIESSTRKAVSAETNPNGQVAKASRGD